MIFLNNLKFKDKVAGIIIFLGIVFLVVQKMFLGGSDVVDNNDRVNIVIGGVNVTVDVAKTEDEKYKGLSFRDKLENNEGMLFLHQSLDNYGYVMRNMKFDLDFIFIKDTKIVDIAKNVSKNYKGIIRGATKYNKVLELPAGWVDRNHINLGEDITVN